jgi:cytochrome P450 PksS
MKTVNTWLLGSAEFKANPYPFYARLRRETPVYPSRLFGQRMWLVTRYDDAVSVLRDERFLKEFPSALGVFNRLAGPCTRHMLNKDAPDHTRLRTLVHKVFTPRMIDRIRSRIETVCHELLDAAERRGRLDVIRDYALPLPLTIIGELLGMPQRYGERFHNLSRASLAASSTFDAIRGVPYLWLITRNLRSLVAERRADPRDDLITALVQAEEAGDRLSEDELVGMIFLLVLAGYETTVNLIGSGALALLQHPEQLARLVENPALAEPAIEELLRHTSPVDIASQRFAGDALAIGGVTIPRGEMVAVILGSANHDETQFPDPDVVDITREPNRHVAFGQGAHFCLGAPLARLEGQLALTTLFDRYPGLHLAVPSEQLRWRKSMIVRGLEALPVALSH